jgi:hypothetical protein
MGRHYPVIWTLLTDAVGEVSKTSLLVSIEEALWPEHICIWPKYRFVCITLSANSE